MNAGGKPTSSELRASKQIPNTPFVAHRYDETWILTIGKYKVGPDFLSEEELIQWIKVPTWETISVAIQGLIEINQSLKIK